MTPVYIHVLDDTSLEILKGTLDTISDFVSYLAKMELLISDGRLGWAPGEDDLLAYYLRNLNDEGEHDFVIPSGINGIFVDEGLWAEFAHHPQRQAQKKDDEISYAWDALIQTFSAHMLAGTQHFTTHPDIRDGEKILRFMARESCKRRRMLARLLVKLIYRTPERDFRAARVVLPSRPGDSHCVFLLLSDPAGKPYDEYREVRRNLLSASN